MLKKIIAGVLATAIVGITAMIGSNYEVCQCMVVGSWEEPEGYCTSIITEYGPGYLLDGYYADDREYTIVCYTGDPSTQYDDELLMIL